MTPITVRSGWTKQVGFQYAKMSIEQESHRERMVPVSRVSVCMFSWSILLTVLAAGEFNPVDRRIDSLLDCDCLNWDSETQATNVNFGTFGVRLRDINSAKLDNTTINEVRGYASSRQGRERLLGCLREPRTFVGAYVALNQLYPHQRLSIPFWSFDYRSKTRSTDMIHLTLNSPSAEDGIPLQRISLWAAMTVSCDYWRSASKYR